MRNANSITNIHRYSYFNPAAYSYTPRQSNPEGSPNSSSSPVRKVVTSEKWLVISCRRVGTIAGVADLGRQARSHDRFAAAEGLETRRRRRARVDGDPAPSTPVVTTARCGNLPAIIEEIE